MPTPNYLTQPSLDGLAATYGASSNAYQVLVQGAQASPYLAGLINKFYTNGGQFQLSTGGATLDDGQFITVSQSMLPNVSSISDSAGFDFATLIAHELGHFDLPGGHGYNFSPVTTPEQAAASGVTNEGVALAAEYVVGQQLNAQLGTQLLMHSDRGQGATGYANRLTPTLTADASILGFNVNSFTVDDQSAQQFTAISSQAVTDALTFTALLPPSPARNTFYPNYYGVSFILGSFAAIHPDLLDASQVDLNAFYTNTSQRSYTSSVNPVTGQTVYTLTYTLKNGQSQTLQTSFNGNGTSVNADLVTPAAAYVFGQGLTLNLTNAAIHVASGSSATINGGGNFIYADPSSAINLGGTAGAFTNIYGNGLTISTQGSVQLNAVGSYNSVSLNSGDSAGVYGSGNVVNGGAGEYIALDYTNGIADAVNVSNDNDGGVTANGQRTGIALGTNSQANLSGSFNTFSLNSGVSAGVFGGGNVINAGANELVFVSATNGLFDTINSFYDGGSGSTANGQQTGIHLDVNAQANINGDGNDVSLNAGDSAGLYGGGDYVHGGSNELIYVSNTNGTFDTINASGDQAGGATQNGQPTGVYLSVNAQANVIGSSNAVYLNAGDSVGAYGGGNSITGGAGEQIVVGNTNGTFSFVHASNDVGGSTTANGQGTGIAINNNADVNVIGDSNDVSMGTGDLVDITGQNNLILSGGTNDQLNLVGAYGSSINEIIGNGDLFGGHTASGYISGIFFSPNSRGVLYGNYNDTQEFGNNSVALIGQYNTAQGNNTNSVGFYSPSGSYAGDTVSGGMSFNYASASSGACNGTVPFLIDTYSQDGFGNELYATGYIADPVVMNFDGGAVTTEAMSAGNQFDMQGDGRMESTGWATRGEGILVYDEADPDAAITSDAQFVAGISNLSVLDTNADGVLSNLDAAWEKLRVWVTDGSTTFSYNQLETLDQLGVSSLNINTLHAAQSDNGNAVFNSGTFSMTDGSIREMASVGFAYDGSGTQNVSAKAGSDASSVNQLISAMASFSVSTSSSTNSSSYVSPPDFMLAHSAN